MEWTQLEGMSHTLATIVEARPSVEVMNLSATSRLWAKSRDGQQIRFPLILEEALYHCRERDGGRWLAAGGKSLGLVRSEALLPVLHATETPLTPTGARVSCGLIVGCRLVDSPGGGSDKTADDSPRAYTAMEALLRPPRPNSSPPFLLPRGLHP